MGLSPVSLYPIALQRHLQLGSHISRVKSLALDTKVRPPGDCGPMACEQRLFIDDDKLDDANDTDDHKSSRHHLRELSYGMLKWVVPGGQHSSKPEFVVSTSSSAHVL